MVRQRDERPPLKLREVKSLVHPEARNKETDRYDSASQIKAGSMTKAHTFDDHREDHDAEDLRRFAASIANTIREQDGNSDSKLIVITTHSIRNLLEGELERLPGNRAVSEWLTAEKTQLSPHDLCADLSRRGLLR